MTKKKENERSRRIIQGYLDGMYDEQTGIHLRGLFAHWFFSDEGRDEKDRILKRLYDDDRQCGGSEVMNRDELARLAEKVAPRSNPRKKLTQRRRPLRVWMSVAAVLMPLLVVTGVLIVNTNRSMPAYSKRFIVMNGNCEDAYLPDSTFLKINSGSILGVDINKKERSARLSGEAFFKVAKQTALPFVVQTDHMKITVLGTEFNVSAYPDQNTASVTLAEGSVKVDLSDERAYILAPNHQLVYDKKTNEVKIKLVGNMNIPLGWMNGVMVCDSMELDDIFEAVERHFNVKVTIDPQVQFSDMVYTIQFDSNDTLSEVMAVLQELVGGFDYTIQEEKVTITKK